MAERISFYTSYEWQKLVMKWTAAGHEVLHDRGTFRHKAFKKDLPRDLVIRREGGLPFITHHDHELHAGDVLPERADLALDAEGNVLPQHIFEKRYLEFLNWFDFVEGSDPKAEPIPNVEQYISLTYDMFSESNGMVEIGFDAHKPAPEERTHMYNPQNDELIEIVKGQGDALDTTLAAVKRLLEDKPPEEPIKRGPGRPRKEVHA